MRTEVEIKAEIDTVQEMRDALGNQVSELEQRKRALLLELIEVLYGVKVGSIVKSNGKRYKVTNPLRSSWSDYSRPWMTGVQQKKDGSWSEREVSIWRDWELVKVGATT